MQKVILKREPGPDNLVELDSIDTYATFVAISINPNFRSVYFLLPHGPSEFSFRRLGSMCYVGDTHAGAWKTVRDAINASLTAHSIPVEIYRFDTFQQALDYCFNKR